MNNSSFVQFPEARWYDRIDEAPERLPYSFAQPVDAGRYSFVGTNEASTRNRDSSSVRCRLCPRQCEIADGRSGFCSVRYNDSGVLRSLLYGRPVSVAIDPIEKKPLYHFLPNTPILSLGTLGCNLVCQFCQNWKISQPQRVDAARIEYISPENVVKIAQAHRCPSVAFTYNEPTIWAEYVVDVAKVCRQAGIKVVAVTNGMIAGRAREEFYEVLDAANVDLKGFTRQFYRDATSGDLDAVKETLEYVAKKTNVWLEVTNLVVPTLNDSPDDLRAMCDWIADKLGVDVPLHFSAFFPAWRSTASQATPVETLLLAADIAKACGLRYVYLGNVENASGQTTFCPNCGASLLERSARYAIRFLDPTFGRDGNARCPKCGAVVAGVF